MIHNHRNSKTGRYASLIVKSIAEIGLHPLDRVEQRGIRSKRFCFSTATIEHLASHTRELVLEQREDILIGCQFGVPRYIVRKGIVRET